MRLFLCLSLLCFGSAALASDWVNLLREQNMTELSRLGSEAGASGLALQLASEDRPTRLAALHAVSGASDSWALLGMLARTAADPDRSVGILAAQVAAEQTHALDAFTMDEEEIPEHDLAGWHGAWLELASQKDRWIDIRVYALEVAAGLHEVLRRPEQLPLPWTRFYADSDAEIRAAAIQLAPRSPSLTAQAETFAATDTSELVALASAQRLCGPLGNTETVVRKAMAPEVWTRMHAMAQDKSLAINARADLANCLILDSSAEGKVALATLTQQSAPSLRKAIAELVQTAPQ